MGLCGVRMGASHLMANPATWASHKRRKPCAAIGEFGIPCEAWANLDCPLCRNHVAKLRKWRRDVPLSWGRVLARAADGGFDLRMPDGTVRHSADLKEIYAWIAEMPPRMA